MSYWWFDSSRVVEPFTASIEVSEDNKVFEVVAGGYLKPRASHDCLIFLLPLWMSSPVITSTQYYIGSEYKLELGKSSHIVLQSYNDFYLLYCIIQLRPRPAVPTGILRQGTKWTSVATYTTKAISKYSRSHVI